MRDTLKVIYHYKALKNSLLKIDRIRNNSICSDSGQCLNNELYFFQITGKLFTLLGFEK